jgi:peptidoglycan/xylan/chitin deacetylase (PgdA/CDA1 family)
LVPANAAGWTDPLAIERPSFLLTVDTEGDDIWSLPRQITTRNAAYLPRFQQLCEDFGVRPTYLANYEMAIAPQFRDLGRDVLARGTAEIGMHLHAWNSPPIEPLTDDDFGCAPYLAEYPEQTMRRKIRVMTDLLGETFGLAPRSHRAGRWCLSPAYARLLVEHGYEVDCSVTPNISWRPKLGAPGGAGGSDYLLFPERPYYLDLDDLSRPGRSPLLEVPLTVLSRRRPLMRMLPEKVRSSRVALRTTDRLLPVRRLTPTPVNLHSLVAITREAGLRIGHAEMAIHSSELMPGGSPSFRTPAAIEALYEALTALFEVVSVEFRAVTLHEYRRSAPPAPTPPAPADP